MRVVRNMTKNGKLMRFNATVASGNAAGGLGVASATHANAQDAIMKAGRLATRNMEYFGRWQDRTLFHDDIVKFKASQLVLRPSPASTAREIMG
jgi:ribosomal protein S5